MFYQANTMVALLCNHQKMVSSSHDKQIESKLNINQFDIALKKELIKNKEPIKVVKIRQL